RGPPVPCRSAAAATHGGGEDGCLPRLDGVRAVGSTAGRRRRCARRHRRPAAGREGILHAGRGQSGPELLDFSTEVPMKMLLALAACTSLRLARGRSPSPGSEAGKPPDKPATEKSVTEKPASEKPAADKPAANKPADKKPATDKPVEGKPVENKPGEKDATKDAPADG